MSLSLGIGPSLTRPTGGGGRAAYLGPVSGGKINTTGYASADFAYSQARRVFYARDTIINPQIRLDNWYANGQTLGAAATHLTSIEYPLGTFTRATMGGAQSGVVADGTSVLTDPVPITIPKGALYRVHLNRSCPAGMLVSQPTGQGGVNIALGERAEYSASPLPDRTMGLNGAYPSGDALGYNTSGILGLTTQETIGILGNSIGSGAQDAYGSSNDFGLIAPSVGGDLGYINVSVSGASTNDLLAAGAISRNLAALQSCTYIVLELSINNLRAGQSVAQLQTGLNNLAAQFPGKRIYLTTTTPNQQGDFTPAMIANLHALNAWKRTVPAPFFGTFEFADAMMTARDSNVWKTGYSTDLLHPIAVGYAAAKASGVIVPSHDFVRY